MNKLNPSPTAGRPTAFRPLRTTISALIVALGVAACASDSRMGETAAGGAVVGAGIGLLIGALGGKPGEGLAVGAALGGAQGAYEGWRQDQDDVRAREIANAVRETKASGASATGGDAASRAREELTRFLGVWKIDGWVQDPSGDRKAVQAEAQGSVQMSNYVQLALMDVQVEGVAVKVWGESLMGYDDDVGYTYSSRINTLPEPFNATGSFDAASRTFTFTNGADRMLVRFENPDRFSLETFDASAAGEQKVESYRFTRI